MLRRWLANRIEQWRRISAIVGLFIQGSALSLLIQAALPNLSLWAVPFILLVVIGTALCIPWAYYGLFRMREAEQLARFDLDLRDQHILSPKESRLLGLLVAGLQGDSKALEQLAEIAKSQKLE